MNFALFDDPVIRQQLLPFTYTRPIAEIRWGILTITEKWHHYLGERASFLTADYLQKKYSQPESWNDLILINGSVVPSHELAEAISSLEPNSALTADNTIVAARVNAEISIDELASLPSTDFKTAIKQLSRLWHIFKEAGAEIRKDFEILTNGRTSQDVNDPHTIIYGKENIFFEEGVKVKAAILDAENGPIYLGKNSTIEAGSIIKGPFALGEGSTINGNGHMRGDISIGPFCKVGGEVSNSVLFAYSNKGHDGFLGNSVLGEWCNIGAGTNVSNLKNNYTKVKIWDYAKSGFINTGEQFCGLIMGDHCKSGIGTTFNTGTVVGVASNIFGAGFPRTYIPSFSWGGFNGLTTFQPSKVKEMASVVMARRNKEFDNVEEDIINHVFKSTAAFRSWESNNK
jgi:UDP-N-acetylglucosamine diphosphorylase/glucosamine-1-phosphate N-acetyltransferase